MICIAYARTVSMINARHGHVYGRVSDHCRTAAATMLEADGNKLITVVDYLLICLPFAHCLDMNLILGVEKYVFSFLV